MNRESSRSHAVFTLVIQATEVVEEEGLTRSRVARFNLVDLAGSERQKDTQVLLYCAADRGQFCTLRSISKLIGLRVPCAACR